MSSFSAIVIDDHSSARSALTSLLASYCPQINVLAEAEDLTDGIRVLLAHRPQIVFLDVELKGHTGFDILKKIDAKDFEVIMVTAHATYAFDAFKHDARQFLLKPVVPEELMIAVQKACDSIALKSINKTAAVPSSRLSIPTSNSIVYLDFNEVVYLQADGSYTHVHTTHGAKHTASKNLGEFQSELPENQFFRCHRSYLINLSFVVRLVKSTEWSVIVSTGQEIDVSRAHHADLLRLLG
ncbi:MAG: LytTR family DNA-binding domain-containing protein [Cryomorphaceae bacterium]